MSVHPNSTLSLNEERSEGRTELYRRAVWDTLKHFGTPLTDRQIMEHLNVTEVNNIRPEITRLKQDGLIQEVGKVKCERTGKTVRQTKLCSTVYLTRNQCRRSGSETFHLTAVPYVG